MWMKSTLTLMVKSDVFKAISVYFSTPTKMVGGDYSQNEKAHTQPGLIGSLELTLILYKSISLFHSLNRMGRFTILVINK